MCLGIVRLESNRPLIARYSLGIAPQALERRPETPMGFREFGSKDDRLLIASDRALATLQGQQRRAKAALRFDVIGIDGERPLIASDRLVMTRQRLKRRGEAKMRLSEIGISRQRLFIGGDCLVLTTKGVQRRGEIGMGLGGTPAAERSPSGSDPGLARPCHAADGARRDGAARRTLRDRAPGLPNRAARPPRGARPRDGQAPPRAVPRHHRCRWSEKNLRLASYRPSAALGARAISCNSGRSTSSLGRQRPIEV